MSDLTLQSQINELRIRCETVEETVRQLRELLAGGYTWPSWLPHLTRREGAILELLVSRQIVSTAMFEATLGNALENPDNMFKLYILKLRRKLDPHGITIVTDWGRGYRLDEASRTALRMQA